MCKIRFHTRILFLLNVHVQSQRCTSFQFSFGSFVSRLREIEAVLLSAQCTRTGRNVHGTTSWLIYFIYVFFLLCHFDVMSGIFDFVASKLYKLQQLVCDFFSFLTNPTLYGVYSCYIQATQTYSRTYAFANRHAQTHTHTMAVADSVFCWYFFGFHVVFFIFDEMH